MTVVMLYQLLLLPNLSITELREERVDHPPPPQRKPTFIPNPYHQTIISQPLRDRDSEMGEPGRSSGSFFG